MNPLSRLFGVVLTFHIVCLGWLVFRADSMQTAALLLHQIFTNFDTSLIPQIVEGYAFSMGLIALGYLLHFIPMRVDGWMRGLVSRAPMGIQVAMLVIVIWCVMQIKSADIQPFIYFQF